MKSTTIVLIILIIILAFGIYVVVKPDAKPVEQPQQNTTSYDIQGMKVEILQQGSGAEAKVGDKVTVNYTGTLVDGTKFDSSLNPGRTPFDFVLGQNRVIQGWEKGVLGMKVGEKRKLTIPPELGYGNQAVGNLIPANATLLFDVELLKIN
jgi:peptidylprolyl isomerase/FKBP-type peptidyl-prolyl cis-trans isomerase FkpA